MRLFINGYDIVKLIRYRIIIMYNIYIEVHHDTNIVMIRCIPVDDDDDDGAPHNIIFTIEEWKQWRES